MFRIAIVSGIALFSVVAANAGQIQIGGANGLTSSTVTGAGCSTGGPCTEQGYVPVMFQGAPVSPPVGPGNLVDTNGDGVGDPVTFSLINDGAGKNFWDLPTGTTTSTLTIPVGVFGVTDVWTMINDIEASNTRDVSVTFNFGTTATTTSDSVTVRTSDADGASASGQVRNGLVCSSGCLETSQPGTGGLAGEVSSGVTVVADNLWNQSFFGCITTSVGAVGGTCGTAYLDDQGFFFNGLSVGTGLTNLNTYLVSVQVKEVSTTGGGAGLSAVTIDTAAATPEPSTVLLFVAGLGVVGLGRLRKRA
jgi:hypothetical protein